MKEHGLNMMVNVQKTVWLMVPPRIPFLFDMWATTWMSEQMTNYMDVTRADTYKAC